MVNSLQVSSVAGLGEIRTSGASIPPMLAAPGARRFARLPITDYLLMFVLVWALSGNPIINVWYKTILSALALLALAFVFVRRPRFSWRAWWILWGFSAICVGQAISTGYFSPVTIVGFFTNLVIALSTVLLVRNFAKAFVDVMFWTAAISLVVYALLIGTQGGLVTMVQPFALHAPDAHILIHYFHPSHLHQNNSYFWEPGVYAGYLVLTIVFLGSANSQYSRKRYQIILLVLVAALATTLSTAGYLLGPLALLYHGKAFGRKVTRGFLIVAAMIGLVYLYQNTAFLNDKVSNQSRQVAARTPNWQLTRLGGLISDWEQIKLQPLFGWGPNPEIRYQFVAEGILKYQGNGLSDFTAKFGFCGLALFLTTTYMGFSCVFNGRVRHTLLALTITALALNGECFLVFPLFLTLMFLRRPSPDLHHHHIEPRGARARDSRWATPAMIRSE